MSYLLNLSAAASARLCVETSKQSYYHQSLTAAASARLCVETLLHRFLSLFAEQPPPRGCVLKHLGEFVYHKVVLQPPPRGCVLKQQLKDAQAKRDAGSRLRAAVC